MGMVVRSNIMALNANRQLGMNNTQVGKSLEKLSSGFRINRAGDDASGLAISEKMKAQIKGLETASMNSQDGISLVQTAEGALTEVHDMLNRMTELATKSSNGTLQNEVDREAIQSEVDALLDEINRIGDSTNFNGIKLLDGSLSTSGTAGTSATTDFKLPVAAGGAEFEVAAKKGGYTNAAGFGATMPAAVGDRLDISVTVNLGNDTFKTVDMSFTYRKNDAGEDVLVSQDGTEYAAAAQGAAPVQTDLDTALLSELNKNAVIKDNFKVSSASGVVKFEARQAGKTGVASIESFAEYSYVAATDTKTTVAQQVNAATDAGGASMNAADAYKGIDITKLKVYDATGAAGTPGTKKIEDAVIEVGGQKFAFISDALTADQISKIDKNINYVVVTGTTITGGTDDKKMANLIRQKTGANTMEEAGVVVDAATTIANSISFKSGTTAGTLTGGLTLQIGDTGDTFNMVKVSVDDMRSQSLGVAGLNVSDADSARSSIEVIKSAINKVSTNRANMGALQNRLEHTINNLDVAAENMNSANSRIRDTDMAKQMMDYTKMNVLTQAAQAMLAQANQQPQSILQLLQ